MWCSNRCSTCRRQQAENNSKFLWDRDVIKPYIIWQLKVSKIVGLILLLINLAVQLILRDIVLLSKITQQFSCEEYAEKGNPFIGVLTSCFFNRDFVEDLGPLDHEEKEDLQWVLSVNIKNRILSSRVFFKTKALTINQSINQSN